MNTEKKSVLLPPKLIIFDLDGTIIDEPEFYRTVYSGTLTQLIEQERGEVGLKTLDWYRQNLNGKGELALMALGIPFESWATRLIDAPADLIRPNINTVNAIKSLGVGKIIFTGSPFEMATKLLERMGFDPRVDFNLIIGWQQGEAYPLKWNRSPFVFESFTAIGDYAPKEIWSVGDNWETDLAPAQKIGMTTVQIKKTDGQANLNFPNINSFITYLNSGALYDK